MKKVILILSILSSTIVYSQDYTGLSGYLTVKDNVWIMTFQNNDYKVIEDFTSLSFNKKEDVQTFYNDLKNSLNIKEGTIEGKGYRLSIHKKMVFIYNDDEKYTMIMKKYSKKGLEDIKNSINYIK